MLRVPPSHDLNTMRFTRLVTSQKMVTVCSEPIGNKPVQEEGVYFWDFFTVQDWNCGPPDHQAKVLTFQSGQGVYFWDFFRVLKLNRFEEDQLQHNLYERSRNFFRVWHQKNLRAVIQTGCIESSIFSIILLALYYLHEIAEALVRAW